MSDYAEITLTGNSRTQLLIQLDIIRKWDNGNNQDIKVFANGSKSYIFDKIESVDKAIKEDLAGYLKKNFNLNRMDIKSGSNDDLWLIPIKTVPGQKKIRNKVIQLHKKKRKKNKDTSQMNHSGLNAKIQIINGKIEEISMTDNGQEVKDPSMKLLKLQNLLNDVMFNFEKENQKQFIPNKDTKYILPKDE